MATNDPRLRGQEVEVRIFTNGNLEDTIVAIASFEETFKLEKKEDGFLGEFSNRYDHIFNGIDGKCEFQVNSADWMTFQNAVKLQAQRKQPATQINLVRTDYYASGQTAIITYADCKFGAMPTSVAGRGEFVKVSLDFSCSDRDEQISSVGI
jgi:hypothetical protein